jgi:hypothetical protein
LLVEDDECFYIFAIPKVLWKPMLSNAEILSLVIVESPYEDDAEPRGEARKLLEILKDACYHCNEDVWHLACLCQVMEAPFIHNQVAGLIQSGGKKSFWSRMLCMFVQQILLPSMLACS